MEIKTGIMNWVLCHLYALAICTCLPVGLDAQLNAGKCEFKDGEFYIELNKNIRASSLDSFIANYQLNELDLRQVLQTGNSDTLKKLGWNIRINNQQKFVITRPLTGTSDIQNPVNAILQSGRYASMSQMFPVTDERIVYGYNRFKNKHSFDVNGKAVRFFLRKKLDAKKVMLAGSFNKWSPNAVAMTKTDSGWIADVILNPGKYWYKFIADGNWMYDTDNQLRENDGLGNINSALFVANTIFRLSSNTNAKKVYLAGSFNEWRSDELQMQRTSGGWELPIYLADGTHTYKFVADGNWMTDPNNRDRLPDGNGSYNSVLRIGKNHIFQLKGFTNTENLVLAGSFNGWRKDELQMKKTATGWELAYALRPGNYEYIFIADGKEMRDPANPLVVNSSLNASNSYLIIGANYTFRLKMPNAKSVYLAGDFNNWSENSLAMIRKGEEWVYSVHLSPGKHKYKFIVDGIWITDPGNDQWEQNEHGTGNSVIWIDEQSTL